MTDPEPLPRWGIVSTVKASARDVLTFAAYHLEQGAHRVCLYLDAPCPEAFPFLKTHPKVRVIDCDDAYWKRQPRERPDAHQLRQTYNANRAYRKQCKDLDWLLHIDVDEFLWAPDKVAQHLARLPEETITARVRPAEVLDGSDRFFRKPIRDDAHMKQQTARLYPTWGASVPRGLFSHRAGKIFVRTGMEHLKLRIHQCFVGEFKNPCLSELDSMDLCHFHARNWSEWLAHFRYRHSQGAYRSALGAYRSICDDAQSMHELLETLQKTRGDEGLRAFYDEFTRNTEERRAELQQFGLLCEHDLHLGAALEKQFPKYPLAVADIS